MVNYNYINIHSHFVHKRGIEIISLDQNGLAPGNEKPENRDISILQSSDAAYFSSGIHPMHAAHAELNTEIFSDPRCVAVGECGLDKHIDVPLPHQLEIFEKQIALSEDLKLPLILHCVKAWNETEQARKRLEPKQTWIFHGFRKTSLLEKVLRSNVMVSIGTAVLYDLKLQGIIPNIPDDMLLLETDDDDQHSIAEVYSRVAELRQISVEQLQQLINVNFRHVFTRFTGNF